MSTKAAGNEPPITHDGSSMRLLAAATNPDPHASFSISALSVADDSALVANVGPEGTLPDATALSRGGTISRYTVQEGDSLSEIAETYGVSTNTILWANDIKDAKTIRPGTELVILPVSGVQYKVVKGDTLGGIAKKYEADADDIAAYNGLGSDATLIAGATVIIPGGNLAPTAVAKSSGAKAPSKAATTPLPSLSGFFGNPMHSGRVTQGLHGHNGIDVGAPAGTPVYSSAAGTIIVAKGDGSYNGGYGNYVVVSHDNGTQTLYAHLSSVNVSVGESVGKDEHIGAVGNTGRSTGYHLHFEVRGAKNPLAN